MIVKFLFTAILTVIQVHFLADFNVSGSHHVHHQAGVVFDCQFSWFHLKPFGMVIGVGRPAKLGVVLGMVMVHVIDGWRIREEQKRALGMTVSII